MKRSPATAFWLSLVPGAGHVYLGQPVKGLVLILLVGSAIHLADRTSGAFGIVIPFLWLFAMIDAHRSAVEINHLSETGQPLPDRSRSLELNRYWGWVLIAIGVLFTLDNFGWFDFDWMWDLWPVALIGLGVYLLKRPEPAPVAANRNLPSPPPVEPMEPAEMESLGEPLSESDRESGNG